MINPIPIKIGNKKVLIMMLICLLALMGGRVTAANRIVFFGLDESGSYSLRTKAVAIAQSAINQLSPEDIFYARRITHESYLDNCAVMGLTLPKIGVKPSNKFDRRAMLHWRRQHQQLARMRSQASAVLAQIEPVIGETWHAFPSVAGN